MKTQTAPASRAAAIDAKCKGCIYDDRSAGTWREQVAACSSSNCPLYDFRPLPDSVLMPSPDGSRRQVDRAALAALRADLERRNRA